MPNIVKITTIINPFNLLAPHSCRGCGKIGAPICNCCKNYIITHHQKTSLHIFAIGMRQGIIKQAIYDLKYSSTRALAKPLAEILEQILPQINGPVSVIPLPTISRHIRRRGLDHTKLIAKNLARLRPNWKVENLIVRNQNTVQVGSSRKKRLTQANQAYIIKPNAKFDPSTTYLLFDDVWTTGASIKAAKKKLREVGAKKIKVAVLAISE